MGTNCRGLRGEIGKREEGESSSLMEGMLPSA